MAAAIRLFEATQKLNHHPHKLLPEKTSEEASDLVEEPRPGRWLRGLRSGRSLSGDNRRARRGRTPEAGCGCCRDGRGAFRRGHSGGRSDGNRLRRSDVAECGCHFRMNFTRHHSRRRRQRRAVARGLHSPQAERPYRLAWNWDRRALSRRLLPPVWPRASLYLLRNCLRSQRR